MGIYVKISFREVTSDGAKGVTEFVREALTEPNVVIRERVVRSPNSCSMATSPDSAYGTEAVRRTSRLFEPHETLGKPPELSFVTSRGITHVQCRWAPSEPNKARRDDSSDI